jgi:hypothetical protein
MMTMEDDFNLYKLIIKSVETQLKDNDPPVTKDTYDRLLANGKDAMIASVIAEEIYLMMKDNRKISVETFSQRLAELQ